MRGSVVGCTGSSGRDGVNTKWREMQRRVRQRQRGYCLLLRHPRMSSQIAREMDEGRVEAL